MAISDLLASNQSLLPDTVVAREWLVDKPIAIGITLVVAFLVHWILVRLINKFARHHLDLKKKVTTLPIISGVVRTEAQQIEDDARAKAMAESREQRRQSRITTLAAVSKSAVAIIVWVWAGLAILSALGVNVAPIIASAGVVGVAIGFGAQSLVKDFLSGIFMLLEDQYGVGDTIDVGNGIVGDVEEVTLRLTTLRDIDGAIWYVRNGEIERVGNLSADYSIARVQIPVGLANDPDHVTEVIRSAASAVCTDKNFSPAIIGEPVLNGVTEFHPDYQSYRVSVRTLPGQQWALQRELYARILKAMNDAGISTPYPHGIGISEHSAADPR